MCRKPILHPVMAALGAVSVTFLTGAGCELFTLVEGDVPPEFLEVAGDWQTYTGTKELLADVPVGTVVDDLSGIVGCWAWAASLAEEFELLEPEMEEELSAEEYDQMLRALACMQDAYTVSLLQFNADGTYRQTDLIAAFPWNLYECAGVDMPEEDLEPVPWYIQPYMGRMMELIKSDQLYIQEGTYTIVDERTVRMRETFSDMAYITSPPDRVTFIRPGPLLLGLEEPWDDDPWDIDQWLTLRGEALKSAYAYEDEDSEDLEEWATTWRRITCPAD